MLGFAIDQGVLRANFTLPAISGSYVGHLPVGSNPYESVISSKAGSKLCLGVSSY